MKVVLKRAFYAKGHIFDPGVQEVPDFLQHLLPSDAEVLAEPAGVAPAMPAPPAFEPDRDRPEAMEDRLAAIREAAKQIDVSNRDNLTSQGKITTQALYGVLGWEPSGQERNKALDVAGDDPAPKVAADDF